MKKTLYRVTLAGLFLNLGLSAGKVLLGWWGGSQAVLADGLHSFTDLITDFLTLFGLKYASHPPDPEHPYGHRRIETLVALIIGLFMALTALGLGIKAVTSLSAKTLLPTVKAWVVLAPLASMISKEVLFRVTLHLGQRERSPAVIANAYHHRSDVWSSLPAFLGAGLSSVSPSLAFADPLGSLVVAFFILKASWEILHPGIHELCDRVDLEEAQKIKTEVLKVPGVRDAHHVRARKHGDHTLVDLHIQVDPYLTV